MKTNQIHLTIEYLAKCQNSSKQIQKTYEEILQALIDESLCAKSMFNCKQLSTLMKKNASNHEEARKYLEKLFKNFRTKELEMQKREIFKSLMGGNFPKHKQMLKRGLENFEASLSEVEAKMYMMIKTYIEIFCEAMECFMIFDTEKKKSVEEATNYALKIHNTLMTQVFFHEEKELLEDALKQLSIVYIGVYYRSYYG